MPLWVKRRSALVLLGLTVFHILLISIQVPRGAEKSLFERAIFFVFAPVQRAATGTVHGLGSLWRNYFDLRGVRAENRTLKQKNFFLSQDIRFLEDRLKQTRSEAQLRESLADFEGSLIPARVIGVDSVNPHQSIVIDKGSFDGVARDMAVCDRTGALVGRTINPIGFKESVVQLITDKDSSVSVRSVGAGLTGSMTGRSTPLCDLHYVLSSAGGTDVKGEEVRTTGYDKIYPAGLPVGVIQEAVPDETSPIFLRIVVAPYFRFDTIDVVAVLTKGPGAGGGR
jgi:rod shape-determining protein MreC